MGRSFQSYRPFLTLRRYALQDPDEKHYVIRMVDSFTFRGHLCIVTELLSINLYELVKANSFAGFSTTLIRRFTMQILGSLALLRHQRVVHCDLKPEASSPPSLVPRRRRPHPSLSCRTFCSSTQPKARSKSSTSAAAVSRTRKVGRKCEARDFWLTQSIPSVHLHSISLLPESRGHPRNELPHGH